jgi:hypothetical protein
MLVKHSVSTSYICCCRPYSSWNTDCIEHSSPLAFVVEQRTMTLLH